MKKCRLCGGKAKTVHIGINCKEFFWDHGYAVCENCHRRPSPSYSTKIEAIKDWNRRN